MKTTWIRTPLAWATLALCLPSCALAQIGTSGNTSRRFEELGLEAMQLAQNAVESALDAALGDGTVMRGPERVVKGAPYCAEAVHETVQWLPDGQGGTSNRIVRKTSTKLCRDGDGRTRQEVDTSGHKRVYLSDPVARESWVLDPQAKTARQIGGGAAAAITWNGPFGTIEQSAWRDYTERMRDWARAMAESVRGGVAGGTGGERHAAPHAPTPPQPPQPPATAVPPAPPIPPLPAVVEQGSGPREMRVYRFDGPGSIAPPGVRWRSQQLAPRGTPAVSPLPAKDIEGLRVNGERSTWTIEAGAYGNEKPIVITRDVWTSPELMLTVMSRDFDPRSGEVNYRLQNVKRGEPDAALMKVPADFKATRRADRSERSERRDERRLEERRIDERRERS